NFQCLPVVALTVTGFAIHIHIRQKVHLDLANSVAVAGLTAPALDVEREASLIVAPDFGFRQLGKQLTDVIEYLCIGAGIGARRAPDRALIYRNNFIQIIDALYFGIRQRNGL